METEEKIVGHYRFTIKDNKYSYDDLVLSRNFSIGGSNMSCIDVSITYKNNEPISAIIQYLSYDPDCSIDTPLDKGKGTIQMIKTLLEYISQKIPSITEFQFEDKSRIESAFQEEIQKKSSRFMKKGTFISPIPLYFLSIAFNGITWYEKYFNARMKDINKHTLYRKKVKTLLDSEEIKEKIDFEKFINSIPSTFQYKDELEPYYNESITYGDFFQSIPKEKRIRLVRDWIEVFMLYHLQDVFSNKDWIIETPITSYIETLYHRRFEIGNPEGVSLQIVGDIRPSKDSNGTFESLGGLEDKSPNEKKGGKKGKRRTKKYYCPNGKIQFNPKYRGLILGPEDI